MEDAEIGKCSQLNYKLFSKLVKHLVKDLPSETFNQLHSHFDHIFQSHKYTKIWASVYIKLALFNKRFWL